MTYSTLNTIHDLLKKEFQTIEKDKEKTRKLLNEKEEKYFDIINNEKSTKEEKDKAKKVRDTYKDLYDVISKKSWKINDAIKDFQEQDWK